MVFAVWACPEPLAEGLAELEDALVASVRLARAEPEQLAFEAAERYGYPAGFLARYFEKLRYRFGPRERAGLYTFLELARDAGLLERCPSCASSRPSRSASHERRANGPVAEILEKAISRRADHGRGRRRAAPLARPRRRRPRRERDPQPAARPGARHVHHRPQPQLHERLRHRLRLLRLLPPAGRPARGLPAAEAGHLQEDRGDARARRHRPAHAGRPPPRPRRRLLRGPLLARSRRATRSTCTPSRRRRSCTPRAARS